VNALCLPNACAKASASAQREDLGRTNFIKRKGLYNKLNDRVTNSCSLIELLLRRSVQLSALLFKIIF